jgi:hypothetical protein
MGWNPSELGHKQFLILSTQAECAPDGSPIALGYHTGHWNFFVQAAAEEVRRLNAIPFAAFCSDRVTGALKDRRHVRQPALSQ